MSNTRHSEPESCFRQERFSSALDFERGLIANLVAKRCELLDSEEDRALLWFIQLLSWQPGGLQKLAAEMIAQFPGRVSTRSMRKFGFKPAQIYDAAQVRIVREETGQPRRFQLRGETSKEILDVWEQDDDYREASTREKRHAQTLPEQYPASVFIAACLEKAEAELSRTLAEVCLNPDSLSIVGSPAWFPDLLDALREYQSAWIAERSAGAVVTSLGKKVFETLDYSLESRCLVLIDGMARTGKTHSAKTWCQLHPDRARYVQTPPSSDDISFFRAIADALGVSSSLSLKGVQMRERIEKTLQSAGLMLVMDEAHYLWPQNNRREALPNRLNWILGALVNNGLPVALISTPQFIRDQKAVEKKTGWNSAQFLGRLGHYEQLPDSLTNEDCRAVATHLLPEGCAKSIDLLSCYAQTSDKYLAAIEIAVTRARFLATKAGRATIAFADLKQAIQGSAIPSDNGLARVLSNSSTSNRRGTIAARPRTSGEPSAAPAPETLSGRQDVDGPGQNGRTISAPSLTPGADRTRNNLEAV